MYTLVDDAPDSRMDEPKTTIWVLNFVAFRVLTELGPPILMPN